MATTVIFRVWPDSGDVIALFPELPANLHGTLCNCYERMGQHGAANYGVVVDATRPADEHEYANLMRELRAIGYDDIEKMCFACVPQQVLG